MTIRFWLQQLRKSILTRRPHRRRTPLRVRPQLLLLEDRVLPSSTYLVTTTDDNGDNFNPTSGSLRQAILDANAAHTGTPASPDLIQFNLSTNDPGYLSNGTQTWWRIQPTSALPEIDDIVDINGYSQSGASPNTLRVELDGSHMNLTGAFNAGRLILAGGYSTVRGLVINGYTGGIGIELKTNGHNHVQGNFIGTDVTGSVATDTTIDFSVPFHGQSYGVHVWNGSSYNVIGTDGDGSNDAGERNVISGNWWGVVLRGSDENGNLPASGAYSGYNVVAGNYIGTNASGTGMVPNWMGVSTLQNAHDDTIGVVSTDRAQPDHTAYPAEGNVISGNFGGILLGGGGGTPAETNGLIAGNLIGTDATGQQPLGNVLGGIGVAILSSACQIGGTTPALANTIATNGGPGVWIFNLLGLGDPTGITVRGNSIHDNGGLGILLGGSYPFPPTTPLGNDSAGHTGPNNLQNYPDLASAASSSTSTFISGTFTEVAEPNTTLTLDFYANPSVDPTGHGQGQTYLGARTVTTDASGSVSFSADLAVGTAGQWISATATDLNGNTSEFIADVQATPSSQTFTQNLPAALPQSPSGPNTLIIDASTSSIDDVVTALAPANLGQSVTAVSVYLNLAPGMYTQQTVEVPAGMTLYINGVPGTTIDPASPAFTVASGNVVVSNVTFVTTGDAPTILVTGGSLTLRNCVIQESTGFNFNYPAISVTGGTVDLGTAADPGGNTINVNGSGTFVSNTTANPISAVGDTFEINGQTTSWPIALTVMTDNSLMLVGNSQPPLTGSVNGTPFTGSITYTTAFGDQITITLSTTATAASPVGNQYTITASLSGPSKGNYTIDPATSTIGTMYVVSVGADPSGTGGKTVTFWDNKGNAKYITAADLSSLDALNLVNQGGAAFDPKSVAQLQAWLSVSPNATTAYQLAAQLAVTDLNVLAGDVHALDLVYAGGLLPYAAAHNIAGLTSGGFIDVQDLMNAANAILGVDPRATTGDPNQAYEAALAQVLQAANANSDFVSQELIWSLIGL